MKRDDVEKIELGKPDESVSTATRKPMSYLVIGLPDHLKAEIVGTGVGTYKYRLFRTADVQQYEQKQGFGSPTPEAALQALKKLLNWEPA
jgi:hypothetical protein